MEVTPEQGQDWGVSVPYASTEELVAAAERAQADARRATERAQDIVAAMINDGTIPIARLARMFGVTRPTLYSWKKASDTRSIEEPEQPAEQANESVGDWAARKSMQTWEGIPPEFVNSTIQDHDRRKATAKQDEAPAQNEAKQETTPQARK